MSVSTLHKGDYDDDDNNKNNIFLAPGDMIKVGTHISLLWKPCSELILQSDGAMSNQIAKWHLVQHVGSHREVHWSQVHITNSLNSLLQNNVSCMTQHFNWLIKEFNSRKNLQNICRRRYELFVTNFINVINRSIFHCKGNDFSFVSIKSAAQNRMEFIPHCGILTLIATLQCDGLLKAYYNFNNHKQNKSCSWCNMFGNSYFLLKIYIHTHTHTYIHVTTYQIWKCVSSGRAVSACYEKQGDVSNIMAQNPQTNIINEGRTKFWSYESVNVKRPTIWYLLIHKG